jgi:hypothetical protein
MESNQDGANIQDVAVDLVRDLLPFRRYFQKILNRMSADMNYDPKEVFRPLHSLKPGELV